MVVFGAIMQEVNAAVFISRVIRTGTVGQLPGIVTTLL